MKQSLTTQQRAYICNNYLAYTDQAMAAHLGVSKNVVINARKAAGLFIPKEVTKARRVASLTGRSTSTEQEDAYIQQHYLTMPVKVLAADIGRSFTFVSTRLRQLGLQIPTEIKAARKASSQIKKGAVPPNKGRKQKEYMSQEAIERSALTRFKPGLKIYNEKYDGAIVCRKDKSGKFYYYIRIAKAHWELLHRHLWMQANGPIPSDMIIAFKDGNTQNCSIDNLEIISRTENMLRNSKHHYPREIIPTLTLLNKIKQTINEKQANKPKRHTV